jgi:hypothetical protein
MSSFTKKSLQFHFLFIIPYNNYKYNTPIIIFNYTTNTLFWQSPLKLIDEIINTSYYR